MVLYNKLKKALLNDLQNLDLWTTAAVSEYACRNRKFIDKLYNRNKVDDSSIDTALEAAVFSQAKSDHKILTQTNRTLYLDSPGVFTEVIIYAWQKGEISDTDFIQIPLDHGYTMATIGERYKHRTAHLLPDLRKIVLTAKFESASKEHAPHHFCETGCCYHDY